jgi:hypothetical protein
MWRAAGWEVSVRNAVVVEGSDAVSFGVDRLPVMVSLSES